MHIAPIKEVQSNTSRDLTKSTPFIPGFPLHWHEKWQTKGDVFSNGKGNENGNLRGKTLCCKHSVRSACSSCHSANVWEEVGTSSTSDERATAMGWATAPASVSPRIIRGMAVKTVRIHLLFKKMDCMQMYLPLCPRKNSSQIHS